MRGLIERPFVYKHGGVWFAAEKSFVLPHGKRMPGGWTLGRFASADEACRAVDDRIFTEVTG